MKLLVTGGAGFIGSNFICYMLQNYPQYTIICLDNLTYAGNLANLTEVRKHQGFRFAKVDICDADAVDNVFAEEHPDIVVNFAAESHVDRSIENPRVFTKSNVEGVGILMDACCKYGVKRFHQISTDEVYGPVPPEDSGTLFTERDPLRPSSPYSASKAAADLLVLAYHRTYGLPVTVSRSCNNYGRFQYPEKLIPCMIRNCLHNQPLPVYGSGLQVRDWLHVEDHCRAVDLILREGRNGEIYNIGAGHPVRNIDMVRHICRKLGQPEALITFVEDRKGHDFCYAVDSAKLQNELGWKPEKKFETEIGKTIQWYCDNREYLR